MRYLFGELLRVISTHSSQPITLLMDDIQFADTTSLLLIGNLLFSAQNCASVFIVFGHRDDEDSQKNHAFRVWLETLSMFNMKSIKLGNMSADSVNSLVSETLHVTPRITRQLSDVLYQKSRGNPLFLRQLMGSLCRQGYIYVELSQPRWSWDLNKIEQHPISSSVLALLMKEMQQLHPNLQLGLGVASCLGSCIGKDVLSILSLVLGVNLVDVLEQVCQMGFMHREDNGAMFRFAHDKIQQAGM
jgi:predicted ATPase